MRSVTPLILFVVDRTVFGATSRTCALSLAASGGKSDPSALIGEYALTWERQYGIMMSCN